MFGRYRDCARPCCAIDVCVCRTLIRTCPLPRLLSRCVRELKPARSLQSSSGDLHAGVGLCLAERLHDVLLFRCVVKMVVLQESRLWFCCRQNDTFVASSVQLEDLLHVSGEARRSVSISPKTLRRYAPRRSSRGVVSAHVGKYVWEVWTTEDLRFWYWTSVPQPTPTSMWKCSLLAPRMLTTVRMSFPRPLAVMSARMD